MEAKRESIDLDGLTFAEAVEALVRLQKVYGDKAKLEEDYMDPYSDSDRKCLYVYVPELETDEQYAQRIAAEEMYERQNEASERAQWERLNEKYGRK